REAVLRAGLGEALVGGRLAGEVVDDSRSTFAKSQWTLLVGRIRPQCRANHCPARGEGSPCPPDVQSGNMAVPNGLLPPRVGGNLLDREVDFDETLRDCNHVRSSFFFGDRLL